jgi:hypothetical protein
LAGALAGDLRGAFLAALRTVFLAVGWAVGAEAVADLSAILTAAEFADGWVVFSVDMLKNRKS